MLPRGRCLSLLRFGSCSPVGRLWGITHGMLWLPGRSHVFLAASPPPGTWPGDLSVPPMMQMERELARSICISRTSTLASFTRSGHASRSRGPYPVWMLPYSPPRCSTTDEQSVCLLHSISVGESMSQGPLPCESPHRPGSIRQTSTSRRWRGMERGGVEVAWRCCRSKFSGASDR